MTAESTTKKPVLLYQAVKSLVGVAIIMSAFSYLNKYVDNRLVSEAHANEILSDFGYTQVQLAASVKDECHFAWLYKNEEFLLARRFKGVAKDGSLVEGYLCQSDYFLSPTVHVYDTAGASL
jgi:hypothetical protein